jgi:hypothetical protein
MLYHCASPVSSVPSSCSASPSASTPPAAPPSAPSAPCRAASARARPAIRRPATTAPGGGGQRGQPEGRFCVSWAGRAVSWAGRAVSFAHRLCRPPRSSSSSSRAPPAPPGAGWRPPAPPPPRSCHKMPSILTEIYRCHACSCQEILRVSTPGQELAAVVSLRRRGGPDPPSTVAGGWRAHGAASVTGRPCCRSHAPALAGHPRTLPGRFHP